MQLHRLAQACHDGPALVSVLMVDWFPCVMGRTVDRSSGNDAPLVTKRLPPELLEQQPNALTQEGRR